MVFCVPLKAAPILRKYVKQIKVSAQIINQALFLSHIQKLAPGLLYMYLC